MNSTPIGNRLHIGIFGRRNAGKSSLINAITNQNIAIVSDVPGTTTDPVIKAMELLPIGPVAIIDTAGLDDVGELGLLRIQKTNEVLRKTNIAIIVINAVEGITEFERNFVAKLKNLQIKTIAVINKIDLLKKEDVIKSETKAPSPSLIKLPQNFSDELKIPTIQVSSATGEGIEKLKKLIGENAENSDDKLKIVGDLIKAGDLVVLVTPIDKAAPKGRLILPQQQTIRDIIESDAIAVVTKEHELKATLEALNKKPALVITDSQAFLKTSADTPDDIPFTSFSILFARYKGELIEMVKGIKKIENLKPGNKVLIVEGCTHHKQADDIGTVKIPRWIRQIAGGEIQFEWMHGIQFTDQIQEYDAIIHCGGCMLNSQEMKYRINYAKEHGVAITNYGMLIGYIQGVLKRALKPFPDAFDILMGLDVDL